MRRITLTFLLGGVILGAGWALAHAQPDTATVRIALLPQWVVSQHRADAIPGGRATLSPELRAAIDGGVVDRIVFRWQRGHIQRSVLVRKPIRVLTGAEADAAGGRGFDLVAVRPPLGASAWTEIEVRSRTGQPDGALVLEIGGEVGNSHQVVDMLALATADGTLHELALAHRALVAADGVPVVGAAFARPLLGTSLPPFRGADGVDFLVARSPVDAIRNGDMNSEGYTNVSWFRSGEWREADRLLVRIPAATLQTGAPGIVIGLKSRTYLPDGGDVELNKTRSANSPRR